MKKSVKVLSILLMALTVLTVICNITYAAGVTPGIVNVIEPSDASGMVNLGGRILGGLRVFGTIASVLIIAILGIKYLTASPEGKADYKANMVPYIVGAVLLFGATNVASLVYNTLNG